MHHDADLPVDADVHGADVRHDMDAHDDMDARRDVNSYRAAYTPADAHRRPYEEAYPAGAGPDGVTGAGDGSRPDVGPAAGATADPAGHAPQGTSPDGSREGDAGAPAGDAPAGDALAGAAGPDAPDEDAPGEDEAVSDEALPGVIEALLFVSNEPVEESALRRALNVSPRRLAAALDTLAATLRESGRGLRLQRGPEGARLVTAPEFASHVERFLGLEASRRLSTAALETLAIIAYRQPVMRGAVEAIRGVSSDAAIATLRARGLIEEAGRAEGPGRPVLWMTTQRFLHHFGLERHTDLPPLPEDVDLPGERAVQLALEGAEVRGDVAALSRAAGAAFSRRAATEHETGARPGEADEAGEGAPDAPRAAGPEHDGDHAQD